jgi:hypothetical protein
VAGALATSGWCESMPCPPLGHRVTYADKDEGGIEGLNSSRMSLYEPTLEELVSWNTRRERLSFTGSDGLAGAACSPATWAGEPLKGRVRMTTSGYAAALRILAPSWLQPRFP